MRTLKKQRNESVKNYEVLQNRCGCGSCGCVCSCSGGPNNPSSGLHDGNNGSAEADYRVNYGANS